MKSLSCLALLLAAPAAAAQSQQATPLALDPVGPDPDLAAELDAWRADHGRPWHLYEERHTGFARLLFGGKVEQTVAARSDADFFRIAREQVDAARELFGVETTTLVPERVMVLPLALAGTTDKVSVQFRQAVDGVPVRGGRVATLHTTTGELLSIENSGLPRLAGFDVTPSLDPELAIEFALGAFLAETGGVTPTEVSAPTLVIHPEERDGRWSPTLVWDVEVHNDDPGFLEEAFRFSVAASGTPRVVDQESLIHHYDVGGFVTSRVTPAPGFDTGGNPPVAQRQRYMRVTSSAGTTTTDADGNFNFPGVSGPLNVTFFYDGSFNNVDNSAGAEYSLTVSLSGTGNRVDMNAAPTEFVTAQSNIFDTLNLLRDWTRANNPADGSMDFSNRSNANLSGSCNAFFNGSSTNYFRAGGGCANFASPSVVAHEQGHWLNNRYGSFNGSDGFGEGNADTFGMYLFDTPNAGVRSGNNTRPYCGDGNGGCYGQVHTDGQVLMGVHWKYRRNLRSTLGVEAGAMVSDLLFSGWMNGFNQGTIHESIMMQLLTLDDDNANVDDGTPHYEDIDAGFVEQGFPHFELVTMDFTNVLHVEDTMDDAGPYPISVDIDALYAGDIVSAQVHHRAATVPGFITTELTRQGTSDTWIGTVAGVPSPDRVLYYFTATDSDGRVDTWPQGAPTARFQSFIGERVVYFHDDFEGPGDNGWTHTGLAGGVSDWERGSPAGKRAVSSLTQFVDAHAAVSGDNVWGNDLGNGTDGRVLNDNDNRLLSPVIDLTGATNVKLQYHRWLTTEGGTDDDAVIRVNGTPVWSNPNGSDTLDDRWKFITWNISSVADDNPAVQLEFRMETDATTNFGGWNIDDVSVVTMEATPALCRPQNYGAGLAGTGGLVPRLDTAGEPAREGNGDFKIKVKDGLPGATAFIGVGLVQLNFPFLGGTLLVAPEFNIEVVLDAWGQATLNVPLGSGLAGQVNLLQVFVIDPQAPQGFAISPGLRLEFCN